MALCNENNALTTLLPADATGISCSGDDMLLATHKIL